MNTWSLLNRSRQAGLVTEQGKLLVYDLNNESLCSNVDIKKMLSEGIVVAIESLDNGSNECVLATLTVSSRRNKRPSEENVLKLYPFSVSEPSQALSKEGMMQFRLPERFR